MTTSHSLLIFVLSYTTNLNKFKGLKSCNMFYDYDKIKQINKRKKSDKPPSFWKLKNTLLKAHGQRELQNIVN